MQILMSSPSKQRAQGMPGARCTRGLVCRNCAFGRTRAYRAAETLRHPLRNGFTAYFVLSPVSGLVCHRHHAENFPQGLAPASRRQDHTTSPYAFAHPSTRSRAPETKASTAFQPTYRDDRETPLGWAGMAEDVPLICPTWKAEYF